MSDHDGVRPPKAYANLDFLHSPDARTLRILAEFLEPQRRFEHYNVKDTVVFFGSARIKTPEVAQQIQEKALTRLSEQGESPEVRRELVQAESAVKLSRYYTDAVELARLVTQWSKGLHTHNRHFIVCSGGGPGIMEAANKGASLAHGKSIGLNISIPFEQAPNPWISRELNFEFHYFFMRKFWFVYLAKALIVFPGGFGTLDELMEVLTLVQTRKVSKPLPIVVFGKEYWNDIMNFEAMARWGTISQADLDLLHFSDTPEEAFEYLKHCLEEAYLHPQSEPFSGHSDAT